MPKLSLSSRSSSASQGEMEVRWDLNRTVAQILALRYILPQPINAEEIAAMLDGARSNSAAVVSKRQIPRPVRRLLGLGG